MRGTHGPSALFGHDQHAFSSFPCAGVSAGTCGSLALPSCYASSTTSVVASLCVSQASCGILASSSVFGAVSCSGQPLSLSVQVTCSVNVAWGAVTPGGVIPAPRTQASLVSSPDGTLAYLFGGRTASGTTSDLFVLSTTAGYADANMNAGEMTNLAASSSAVAFQSSVASNGFPWLAISSQASPSYTNAQVR